MAKRKQSRVVRRTSSSEGPKRKSRPTKKQKRNELTLRELWLRALPKAFDSPKPTLPLWPPDTFALCAEALRRGSAYVNVLRDWPPHWQDSSDLASWTKEIRNASQKWLQAIFTHSPFPARIKALWGRIVRGLDQPLAGINKPKSSVGQSLLELLAIADEACSSLLKKVEVAEFSSRDASDELLAQTLFDTYAHLTLQRNGQRSLCQEIDPSRLRVLPKCRVPQRGLTLRSLSLFAGLVESEVDARFFDNRQVKEDLTLNLLVIPWPFVVRPSQFRQNNRLPQEMKNMSEEFGFFTFDGRGGGRDFVRAISEVVRLAEEECGKVSFVVLPELALTDREANQLRNKLAAYDCGLIAGIGSAGESGKRYGTNRVRLYVPGLIPVDQDKQHRWKLDRAQILQYSLGNSLHHERMWWEHIDIAERRLSFLRMTPWLTVCVLLCEDLARPDPASDVVRAVAPNLVISLLMDGPQLATRWAARHATTLAEDPGSSVLTVTSLGMAQLSHPFRSQKRGRVIGLWKEEGASSIEIELPPNRDAAVLSVSMKGCLDWSADGRNREASIASLTGVRYLKWPGQASSA